MPAKRYVLSLDVNDHYTFDEMTSMSLTVLYRILGRA